MPDSTDAPRPRAVTQYVGARMSAAQILALDEIAAQEGIDRAGVVSRALDAYLRAELHPVPDHPPDRFPTVSNWE